MSSKRKSIPVALTIAGSDSGGGAGIQADLKTFASLGVHGTSALTCITAQNPKGVLGIQAVRTEIVVQQLDAIFAAFQPRAVKTGMLFSAEIISAVADFLSKRRVPLIVDPVMVATSGASLLKKSAIHALEKKLFPLATLITPNLDEAAVSIGRKISTLDELRRAAQEIHERFGCATLVKGGHLRGERFAADFFYDGKSEIWLRAKFIKIRSTHGTGCTFSAAIAGFLAKGDSLPEAVRHAKKFITGAIQNSVSASGNSVLKNFN